MWIGHRVDLIGGIFGTFRELNIILLRSTSKNVPSTAFVDKSTNSPFKYRPIASLFHRQVHTAAPNDGSLSSLDHRLGRQKSGRLLYCIRIAQEMDAPIYQKTKRAEGSSKDEGLSLMPFLIAENQRTT
jgi:hypothetical protein